MMERIRGGFRLARHSWHTLHGDRSLAALPVLGALTTIFMAAAFFAPTALLYDADQTVPAVLLGAVGVYATTFVGVFFGVALAAAAAQVFDGEDATVASGIAVARSRLVAIAGWAGLAASVNIVIRALEERLGGVASLLLRGIDVAWELVTFLALPVIAAEDLGPVATLKRSAGIFRERWGEQVTGQATIGVAAFVVMLPIAAIGALGVALTGSSAVLGVALIAAAVFGIVGVAVLSTCLTQIFSVALYRYAASGSTSGGFSEAELAGAVVPRRRAGAI